MMFEILAEWFGQPMSLPLAIVDICFLALGIFTAIKGNRRTVIIVVLAMIALFGLSIITNIFGPYMFAIFAVFTGGIAALIVAGVLIGLGINKIKH